MKTHPVQAELPHVDRRTDRQTATKKLRVTLCILASVPEIKN